MNPAIHILLIPRYITALFEYFDEVVLQLPASHQHFVNKNNEKKRTAINKFVTEDVTM